MAGILTPTEAQNFGVPFGTTQQEVIGLSPLAPTQRQAASAFNSAREIINQIGKAADKIITADNFIQAQIQGVKLATGASTKANADAVLLESKKQGLISLLVRALGEKGVLTTQDVDRVRKLLPTFNDTREIKDRKFTDLRAFIDQVERDTLTSLTAPIKGGEFQIQRQQEPDPLNIFGK